MGAKQDPVIHKASAENLRTKLIGRGEIIPRAALYVHIPFNKILGLPSNEDKILGPRHIIEIPQAEPFHTFGLEGEPLFFIQDPDALEFSRVISPQILKDIFRTVGIIPAEKTLEDHHIFFYPQLHQRLAVQKSLACSPAAEHPGKGLE